MIEIIKRTHIDASLENNHRQYLVGNLQLPQKLVNIYDEDVEMGITKFQYFTSEKPHFHPEVTEYQIILHGTAKYVDVQANKEFLLEQGDVFVIRPHTIYILKAIEDTQILFFKVPGKNDKMLVEMTERMAIWTASWDSLW